jgi:hypothetical protein
MGHDSERAARIHRHETRGEDKAITDAIDAHVGETREGDKDASRSEVPIQAGEQCGSEAV